MTDVEVPRRLRGRPRDHRGFLVPHFVAWFKAGAEVDDRTAGAEPDFRVVSRGVLRECVRKRRCWLCGQPLGSRFAFVMGPMCTVSRTNSEPPCHTDCATYAAQACPFLGACAVWVTRSYRLFDAHRGNAGTLFNVGPPLSVTWYREGRPATRREINESINDGLPALRELAENNPDKAGAADALAKCLADLEAWLPRESMS